MGVVGVGVETLVGLTVGVLVGPKVLGTFAMRYMIGLPNTSFTNVWAVLPQLYLAHAQEIQ